ncbi:MITOCHONDRIAL FERREDOXIN [Pimephales promelas]|nr:MITOCHONDRIAL FERREDOXIN [Pimephales promelas]
MNEFEQESHERSSQNSAQSVAIPQKWRRCDVTHNKPTCLTKTDGGNPMTRVKKYIPDSGDTHSVLHLVSGERNRLAYLIFLREKRILLCFQALSRDCSKIEKRAKELMMLTFPSILLTTTRLAVWLCPCLVSSGLAFSMELAVLGRSSLALVCHPRSTRPHLRFLHTAPKLCSQSQQNGSSDSKVLVHFVNQSGVKSSVFVTEGESLLDVVIKKNLDISGFGACEGTLACSTCHLIFEESVYDKLEPIVDEETDMLDLAYGLTKTSRLGCQVIVEPWMDGMTVHVPHEINDQRGKQEAVSSK